MGSGHIILLVIVFLALCVATAGLAAGAVGYSWWKPKGILSSFTYEQGLWRSCNKDGENCVNRDKILEFKDGLGKSLELDVVLILLIGAGAFALFGLMSSLTMFCCQSNKGAWKCGGAMVALCSFVGASAGLGAVIYAEIEFETLWNFYDHGWSAIAAWIGGVMCLLSFVLSIVLSCITPVTEIPGQVYAQPVHASNYNKGYESQGNGEIGYQMT